MAYTNSRDRGSSGGLFWLVSVVILVVVVLAVGLAAALLARTLAVASSINDKAAVIATTGMGINTATDSVIQLNRTNKTAESILTSAQPLEASLTTIVGFAGQINSLAASINDSAGSVNGTAGEINNSAGAINNSARTINASATAINQAVGPINRSVMSITRTASGINGQAAAILDVAQRIDVDAQSINNNLDETIGIAEAIEGDTSEIVREAVAARQTSGCIAEKLFADGNGC
ncbi:MAG TPA: hypothetical protein VE709_07355 [Pseudonocardiaceae bacterium]|jgi:methyl-accepting chemotaxis protein|nr:hypothetical protein [Pseudonocardiaceae bacterium]